MSYGTRDRSAKRPAPVIGWRGACGGGARRARSDWTGYAGLAERPVAPSLLQFRAQLQGPAQGLAHPPVRTLGTPRGPG